MKPIRLFWVALLVSRASLGTVRATAQEMKPDPGSAAADARAANVTPARLIKKVLPNFPGVARFEQLDGTVVLRVTIGADGTVKKINPTRGLPQLLPSATHAVAQWIYEPCRLDRVPIQCDAIVTVDFGLEKIDAVAGGQPPQWTSVTAASEPVTAPSGLTARPSTPIPPAPPGVLRISSRVMESYLEKRVDPAYPPDSSGPSNSKDARGTVIVLATIGKEGDVTDIQIISGPQQLRAIAADAVKQWKYRPYLVEGNPVDVQTTIAVGTTALH